MPKLSPPTTSAFSLRLVGEEPCGYCGIERASVYWEIRPTLVSQTRRVSLCVECMLSAVEAATGFGFVNQYHQWARLSAMHKAGRLSAPKGKRSNDKA